MKSTKELPRPESVRILGRTYSITYFTHNVLNQSYLGMCDHHTHTIHAADNQPAVEEADTLLHEVFHAIRQSMRVTIDPDTEELLVTALATGLIGVLQDNPAFAAWLIADRNK